MKRILGIVFVMFLLLTQLASAQSNVARFGTERNRVYTSVGIDPAVVSTVGYGRVVSVAGHAFNISGDVGVVAAGFDFDDARARAGVETSLLRWKSVHLTGSAVAVARSTENVSYRAVNFGADITGSLGVYRPRWFVAGEFGKDKAVVTHVTHTDYYRETFYPDAKDGWYLDAGGTFHYGFAAGLAVRGVEVSGRFGWLRTEDFNDVMPPVYASVGVGFWF